MSDCRFGVSPVNYPDPDPDKRNWWFLLLIRLALNSFIYIYFTCTVRRPSVRSFSSAFHVQLV